MEESIGVVKLEDFDPDNFVVIKTEHENANTTEDGDEEGPVFTEQVSNFCGNDDEIKTEEPFYYFEEEEQEQPAIFDAADVKNEVDDDLDQDNIEEDAGLTTPIIGFGSPSPSGSSESNYVRNQPRKKLRKAKQKHADDDEDSSEEYLPPRRKSKRRYDRVRVSPCVPQTNAPIKPPKFFRNRTFLTMPDTLAALEKERVRLEIGMKFGSICENIMAKKSSGTPKQTFLENWKDSLEEEEESFPKSAPKLPRQRKQELTKALSAVGTEKFVEIEVPGFPNIVGFDFDMLNSIKVKQEPEENPLISEILIEAPTTVESLEEPVQFVPAEYHDPQIKSKSANVPVSRLKLSMEVAAKNESKLSELSEIYSAVDGVTSKFLKSLPDEPPISQDNDSTATFLASVLGQKKRTMRRSSSIPKFPFESVAKNILSSSLLTVSNKPSTSTTQVLPVADSTNDVKPSIKKLTRQSKSNLSNSNNDPLATKSSDKPHTNLILMSEIAKELMNTPGRSPTLLRGLEEDTNSSVFSCWKCDSKFPLRVQVNRHIKLVHGGSISKRTDLDYYYSKLEPNGISPSLDKMRLDKKEAAKKRADSWMFKCSICGTRRKKWISVKRHLESNHKGGNGKVVSNHLAGPGTLLFKCLYCSSGGSFGGYVSLTDHFRKAHPELSRKSFKNIPFKRLTLPSCSVYLTNIREKKNKIASILQSIVSSMNMVNTEAHTIAPTSGNAYDNYFPLMHGEYLNLDLDQQEVLKQEDIPISSSSNKSLKGCVSSSSKVLNFEPDFECYVNSVTRSSTMPKKNTRSNSRYSCVDNSADNTPNTTTTIDDKLITIIKEEALSEELPCLLCNEKFSNSKDLIMHYGVHTGENVE